MNLSNEKNEETKQFEKIWDEASDPIFQAKKRLEKQREEIKKDKDFII